MNKRKISTALMCVSLWLVMLLTGCDDGLPRAPEGGLKSDVSTTTSTTTEDAGSVATTTLPSSDGASVTSTSTTKKTSGKSSATTTSKPTTSGDSSAIGENTVFDFVNDGAEGNLAIKDKFGNTAKCEYVSLDKDTDGKSRTWSDFTFVEGKLWVFFASSDEEHAKRDGIIRVYDPETGKLEKSFYHDFGHCATVDYNAKTDRLLIGNSPGNDRYSAALYIFDDVAAWAEKAEDSTVLFTDAVSAIVDLSDIVREGTTHATDTTACWGEDTDTVYVAGSFGQYWWKINLGTGKDKQEKGAYKAASDDRFNGSYKVSWMRTFELKYSTYQECVQGMVFYDDCIHTANGHHKIQWWEWMTYGEGMSRVEHHIAPINADGSGQNCISEGIAILDGYLYVGCLFTDKGSDDYAQNHSACTGDHGIIKVKLQ